jgi:tRNA pseudouridine55 synthase
MTSHDVVARVRRLAGQQRVGHAGTLDPMATGVLLICLGRATRLIEYVMAGQKIYRATIRFGVTTDTLDAEGEVVAQQDPSHLDEAGLRALLPQFVGRIEQVPPIFSAIKQGGQPLYKRARAKEPVEIGPRQVTIEALTWGDWQPPDLTLEVTCSPGTYIRALARDLGEAAGVGAHLTALRRTQSGRWRVAEAVPLAMLEGAASWQSYLQPPDQAVAHLPAVALSAEDVRRVRQGQRLELEVAFPSPPGLLRAYTPAGEFLAILALADPTQNLWHPKKVFHPDL